MIKLFGRNPAREAAEMAYGRVVAHARQPVFFSAFEVPDTLDGRFELICLHAFLYLRGLKAAGRPGVVLGQLFFDSMFADFDRSLRELGTGDLSVGREIKQMAEAFYGRIKAYEQGLAGGEAELCSALRRNLFGTSVPAAESVAAMAIYLREQSVRLLDHDAAALLAGRVVFELPRFPPHDGAGDAPGG